MNDRERIDWLAVRAAAMFGTDRVSAAAAARDSARLGDCFRLALGTGRAPQEAMRQAVDSAAAMPSVAIQVAGRR